MNERGVCIKDLREYLSYDPVTGDLIWKKRKGSKPQGSIAGFINPQPGAKSDYISIEFNGIAFKAHRIAWALYFNKWPDGPLDHINHDGKDNRIGNLRGASASENARNRRLPCTNRSGLIGVSWYKRYSKWVVQAYIDDKRTTLGYFENIFEAACCRKGFEARNGYHRNHGRSAC